MKNTELEKILNDESYFFNNNIQFIDFIEYILLVSKDKNRMLPPYDEFNRREHHPYDYNRENEISIYLNTEELAHNLIIKLINLSDDYRNITLENFLVLFHFDIETKIKTSGSVTHLLDSLSLKLVSQLISVRKERQFPLPEDDYINKLATDLASLPDAEREYLKDHFRRIIIKAKSGELNISPENTVAEQTWVERTSSEKLSSKQRLAVNPDLPTSLPEVAPIKWSKRKIFIVCEIKDEYTRKRLEANPELEGQIRNAPDALTFFNLVWKPFVDANLLFRTDLAGQKKTSTNQNPTKPLDKRLVDVLDDEKAKVLPNISDKIDQKIATRSFSDLDDIRRTGGTLQMRKKREML